MPRMVSVLFIIHLPARDSVTARDEKPFDVGLFHSVFTVVRI